MSNGWIQTYTGKQFWPLDPRPADVDLHDIAHALSLKCRFGGHCKVFYSVAEHSVRVLRHVAKADGVTDMELKAALLHDAAEAYLPDLLRPIKGRFGAAAKTAQEPNLSPFAEIERRLQVCIGQATDVLYLGSDWIAVKHADDVLLATEARDLMGPPPEPWPSLPTPLPQVIVPWTPEQAKAWFLHEASRLDLKVA